MSIEASDREMDTDMLGIESRTIGEEMPKKLRDRVLTKSYESILNLVVLQE